MAHAARFISPRVAAPSPVPRARSPRGVGVTHRVSVSPQQHRHRRHLLSAPSAVASDAGADNGSLSLRVLITGSTKGLGLALAQGFLAAGDRVVVTSRDGGKVAEVVDALGGEGSGRVCGTPADVSRAESVAALAAYAVERMVGRAGGRCTLTPPDGKRSFSALQHLSSFLRLLKHNMYRLIIAINRFPHRFAFNVIVLRPCSAGGVDVWINNAGTNGYAYENLADADPAVLEEIVLTNSLGWGQYSCIQLTRSFKPFYLSK
jgi:NAD(P)-dependent dehydrogenase (short-subunit alcohol dehydrogenase family)